MGYTNMVRLDYFTMKPNLKSFAVVILFVLSFWVLSTSVTLLLINCAWYMALISTNLFALEEKNGLRRLYGMLALRTRDIVLGRYLFVLLIYVLAACVVLSLAFVALGIFPRGDGTLTMDGLLLALSASLLIYCAIIGAQMPFFFKLGYNKGRFYAMVPFFLVMGLATIPTFAGDALRLYGWVLVHTRISALMGVVLSILLLALSYRLSLFLYERQR